MQEDRTLPSLSLNRIVRSSMSSLVHLIASNRNVIEQVRILDDHS